MPRARSTPMRYDVLLARSIGKPRGIGGRSLMRASNRYLDPLPLRADEPISDDLRVGDIAIGQSLGLTNGV